MPTSLLSQRNLHSPSPRQQTTFNSSRTRTGSEVARAGPLGSESSRPDGLNALGCRQKREPTASPTAAQAYRCDSAVNRPTWLEIEPARSVSLRILLHEQSSRKKTKRESIHLSHVGPDAAQERRADARLRDIKSRAPGRVAAALSKRVSKKVPTRATRRTHSCVHRHQRRMLNRIELRLNQRYKQKEHQR